MDVMLDKKQIQTIFSFESKIGHKVVETTCNINNCIWPRTSIKHTVQ